MRSCNRKLPGEYSTESGNFWKKLWSLKLPGKVINFLWRVCKGCLPTTQALAQKQVVVDARCPWCHADVETDVHVLFSCDFSRTVWFKAGLQHLVQVNLHDTAFLTIKNLFAAAVIEQCVHVGMLCWDIWNRRNKWLWDRANGSIFGVCAAAMDLLRDWKEAQVCGSGGGK